jgi:hypothetical protein
MMCSQIEPLYIATVGGKPLRFFRTPLDDGRPDLPWHCVDDLHRCLGLNRDLRRIFLRKLKSARWPTRTIAAADGIITIAPHFVAQGTVDAMTDEGEAPKSVGDEYYREGAAALKKLAPFAFRSDEGLDWMKAAMNRWEGSMPCLT